MKKIFNISIIALCSTIFLFTSSCMPKIGSKGGNEPAPTSETKLDHLVIFEVFYSGYYRTKKEANGKPIGRRDFCPQYIKIYNPTQESKYLDGLCIAVSRHENYAYSEINLEDPTNNFMEKNFAMNEILEIPGSGKEYELKPGETCLIARMAVDFTKDDPEIEYIGLPNLVDLSKANFEWLQPKQIEDEWRSDNAAVPNLRRKFYYESSGEIGIYGRTLVLFEPKDKDYFTKMYKRDNEFFKSYTVTVHNTGTASDIDYTAPIIPNEWIIDAVNICSLADYKMRNISEDQDKGYYGVSQRYNKYGEEGAGLAMRRKWNGKIFEDINNSSSDFETVEASILPASKLMKK